MEDNDIIERTVNKLVAAPAVAARTCTSRGGTFDDLTEGQRTRSTL
jgi:hypothetical protein